VREDDGMRLEHHTIEQEPLGLIDELGLGDEAVHRPPALLGGDAKGGARTDERFDRDRPERRVALQHDVVVKELAQRLGRMKAHDIEGPPALDRSEDVTGSISSL
jgi:hypothetical protein